ncbi:hypothetical protein MMC18_005036 [Xylographa bjoerkii]|nr:hypothetical protein [Xylographa bjoerkii]
MFHRFRRKKGEVPNVDIRAGEILNADTPQDADDNSNQDRTLHHSTTTRRRSSSYNIPIGSNPAVQAETRLIDRSRERGADPLGLNIIYESKPQATVDIVFVHGLGGSSHKSWSKDRNPELFWPQKWLPSEPAISAARIFSFGYNAAFQSRSTGKDNILNISDFAKDLLFSMKFAAGDKGKQLNMGQLPIIFVAHSMGGLVVKKALILGQYDQHYKDMVQAIRAVLFLSTPHRGTNLAEILNRILTVSVFGHSRKQYISELKSNSLVLQEINEQFRNLAPRLAIVSFYETFETTVGPIKMMVLQKDSSILGYPEEISMPLNADHHDVCKYTSQKDPSYISVRNVLSHLLEQFQSDDNSKSIWQKLFMSALFKTPMVRPIYLIVDALDECETATSLLKLFADTPASAALIRVIFLSRDNQSLSTIFETTWKSMPVTTLSINESQDDLRLYVTEELKSMRGDPGFKMRVAAEIFEKADGNFLWVHLVLREVLQCHTQGAVAEALNEIPADLEALYERMLASLEKNLRPTDQAMGRTMLLWATCARRSLTLAELARALQPEYPLMLDLNFTISQVCGEFVVVDNLSQISMVHSTAREYLTRSSNTRFGVSVLPAHQQIFTKCLTVLVAPNVRSQVEQLTYPSFLLYSATSWPYHLELAAAAFSDVAPLILLAKFFRGSSVLTWIHILAISGQLSILVQASKALNALIGDCNKLDVDRISSTQHRQDKELVALWATDLIRIVGKFGTHLMRHPKAIYKLIPSFCPHKSMICQQFGAKQVSSPMSISGFSNTAWDSCLAKFSVAGQNLPLEIVCLNQYFSIVMSDGVVILYHSSTYEEARRFSHGEYVLTLCFSSDGEKLVTYGLSTTKVWCVASTRQLYSFLNPTKAKALAVAFKTGDDALIVCSDDRAVRCVSLDNADDGWELYEDFLSADTFEGRQYNSPRNVSFSPDSDQVAVAFRGFPLSVWWFETPRPRFLGRCERDGDKGERLEGSQSNYTDEQTMCWNPITKHVLGTYNDGCIFKWHPFENDYHESNILAVSIKCSPNGEFFVTSSVDGVLRIWDFQHFSLIYQLSCTSSVTDLAIDPDGRRIYDLRDTFCSIWEPNILLRLYEADEKASETTITKGSSTLMSMASETSVEMLEPVTAISINPQTLQYAVGNDEGSVRLFGTGGELVMELSQSFMTVEHIVWSEDGTLVAISDLSRRISIKSVNHKDMTKPLESVLIIKEEDPIQQFIFNSSTDLLLVCTARFLSVWSLKTMASISTRPQTVSGTFWATHPSNNALLLGVDNVWFWGDGTQALVETSQATPQGRRKKQFMIIDLALLPIPDSSKTETKISPRPLPANLLAQIEMPLGFLANEARQDRRKLSLQSGGAGSLPTSGNTLVFLDREFWVCTWTFTDSGIGSRVRRYFFLPRDWHNMECLELAVIRRDGTLVCPRNGEVALVWNGLKEEWIE